MAQISFYSGQVLRNASGTAYLSAKLYFWSDVGVSVPLTTYSDAGLTTPNTNSVVADGTTGAFGLIFLQAKRYWVTATTSTASGSVSLPQFNAGPIDGVQTRIYSAGAPSPTYPGLQWVRTTDNTLFERNSTDTAWLNKGNVDTVLAGKQTIWVPASSMTPRLTNGAAPGIVEMATNFNMEDTLDFNSGTIQYAQWKIRMPKSWDESTMTAQFYWSHAAAATFVVIWGIQAVALSDGDLLDTAFGTAVTVTDTGGTTNKQYASTETAAFTISNTPSEGDMVQFQVYRKASDASDTLDVDARLEGVALFYTNAAVTDD